MSRLELVRAETSGRRLELPSVVSMSRNFLDI